MVSSADASSLNALSPKINVDKMDSSEYLSSSKRSEDFTMALVYENNKLSSTTLQTNNVQKTVNPTMKNNPIKQMMQGSKGE